MVWLREGGLRTDGAPVLKLDGGEGCGGGPMRAVGVVVLCDKGELVVLSGVGRSGLVVGWWCFLGAEDVGCAAVGV